LPGRGPSFRGSWERGRSCWPRCCIGPPLGEFGNYIIKIKRGCSKPVNTRRSTVLSLPLQ
jgi:hypothetical protein